MYRPPEKIKHPLPVLAEVSAEQVDRARLFQPLELKSGLRLHERSWVPAMVPWRATPQGEVNEDVLQWYERFARGQPGALVVEATGIRDVPSGPLLRIGHDRYIPGLQRLVERVREASQGRTRLFIQVIDFLRIRRRPDRRRYLLEFLNFGSSHAERLRAFVSDIDEEQPQRQLLDLSEEQLASVLTSREWEAMQFGERERVWDVEQPHIQALPLVLPRLFADAAERAQKAGFDGVELHYAHAYTMASFLSPLNQRSDGYGGARSDRVRLPLEVYHAVRERVGEAYTVGCRMLCDEIIEGGGRVPDAAYFAQAFAAAGMDYISLSTGGKFEDAKQPRLGEAAYPYTGRSGWECMPTTVADERGPFGRNIAKQAAVRQAVRAAGHSTPTVICGGIQSFEQAEGYLQSGDGDLIGAARQSLADPDWFRKVRLGRVEEIRRCTYRNYCEALDQKHRQVTCQLWDRLPATQGDALSHDGKRRLVAPAWQPRVETTSTAGMDEKKPETS